MTDESRICAGCSAIVPRYKRHCSRCEGNANRVKHDELAEVIRELKASPPRSADERKRAARRLSDHDHPFVDEFLEAISRTEKTAIRRGDL